MAVAMAARLRSRNHANLLPYRACFAELRYARRFCDARSSKSDAENNQSAEAENNQSAEAENSNSSNVFEEVRSSFRNPFPQRPTIPASTLESAASMEEIRKNLSEFRVKSAAPERPHSAPFFRGGGDEAEKDKLTFDSIRESIRNLKPSKPAQPPPGRGLPGMFALKSLSETLNLNVHDATQPGRHVLPPSPSGGIFSKEKGFVPPAAKAKAEDSPPKAELMKMYSYEELGKQLKMLKSSDGKKSFSISEMKERLMKLRQAEEKATEMSNFAGGISFKDLRASLVHLREVDEQASKKLSFQRLLLISKMTGKTTQDFIAKPPKDHLMEQYYHPDNMSAQEKINRELQKLRKQFRMHEGDCGSSRVQIAQLTLKIKYLSKVLRKKDKHSRRGLELMVQRRRKLLKYLRRTDFESYCFVLYKLGLKDTLAPKAKRYA